MAKLKEQPCPNCGNAVNHTSLSEYCRECRCNARVGPRGRKRACPNFAVHLIDPEQHENNRCAEHAGRRRASKKNGMEPKIGYIAQEKREGIPAIFLYGESRVEAGELEPCARCNGLMLAWSDGPYCYAKCVNCGRERALGWIAQPERTAPQGT